MVTTGAGAGGTFVTVGAVWGAAGLVSAMAIGAAAGGGAPWCFIKRMPVTPANPASRMMMMTLGLIFSGII